MLSHPTLDKLQSLRLRGMYQALTEQMTMPDIGDVSFDERLGLLVDHELTERDDRQLTTRLHKAKLRQAACRRALKIGACSYKSLESILKQGLDTIPLPATAKAHTALDHANIRGPKYDHSGEGPSSC